MTLEELRNICLSLAYVTEDIKWENHLCFNVGDKMFMITSPDTFPITISLKVTDEDFISLCEKEGIQPAPYLARYKWVHVSDISILDKKEWVEYSRKAYQIVYDKLSKKVKMQLTMDN